MSEKSKLQEMLDVTISLMLEYKPSMDGMLEVLMCGKFFLPATEHLLSREQSSHSQCML